MRIQYLLEMKSNQEHRNLTMDDLSEATGLSRSALYKMNSDSNYNPSKEVMEKLVVYFQCTLDDLFDRTIRVTFDLRTAFPAEKDLSAKVISLLAASNDVTFLRRLWLRYENQSESGILERVRGGEKAFIFFLELGFLREGMKAFRRLLEDKIASQLFKKMDAGSKKAFESLKKESDDKNSLYAFLIDIRNDVVFHYQLKAYAQALHTIKQEKGDLVVGQTFAETRFLVADDIRSEIMRTSINFDIDAEHEKMERLKVAANNLMIFSNGFSFAYLKHQGVI